MIVTDKQIYNKLRTNIDEIKTLYDEENIFGIYAYGEVNRGIAETVEDIHTEIIYIPTFEELCFEIPRVQVEYINGEEVFIRDIRLCCGIDNTMQIRTAEALYTPYYLVNPKYELVYKNCFIPNRDKIVSATKNSRLVNVAKKGIESLKNNDYYHAYIYYTFCYNFFQNDFSFNDSICYDNNIRNIMLSFKHKDSTLNLNEYRETFEDLFTRILYLNPKVDESGLEDLKDAIEELIKASINKDSNKNELDAFLDSLTAGETDALKAVIQTIGAEGIVNISRLSEDTGVSRQSFSNLFNKIKTAKIANIKNMGMKGTQIKFMNSKILEELK